MTEPAQEKISRELAVPQDGKGARVKKPGERYCAVCGADANVHGLAVERFGEAFCSDGHAEEFVKEVRAARIQAAAVLAAQAPETEAQRPETTAAGPPKPQDWKRYLKMGACCGAPLLALVFLAGGGGAVLGAAGAILPLLAVLACPIGMYFMMRGMGKMEQHGKPKDKDEEKSSGPSGR